MGCERGIVRGALNDSLESIRSLERNNVASFHPYYSPPRSRATRQGAKERRPEFLP
jgi:hypothetical protein